MNSETFKLLFALCIIRKMAFISPNLAPEVDECANCRKSLLPLFYAGGNFFTCVYGTPAVQHASLSYSEGVAGVS